MWSGPGSASVFLTRSKGGPGLQVTGVDLCRGMVVSGISFAPTVFHFLSLLFLLPGDEQIRSEGRIDLLVSLV